MKKFKVKQFLGLGRRKKAVARVWLREGTGKIIVNKIPLSEYFPSQYVVDEILAPLKITANEEKFDIHAIIKGGGFGAQGDALKLGIAKAICAKDEATYRPLLKKEGLLTTDSRIKERKKYGLKKARKAPQFSKR